MQAIENSPCHSPMDDMKSARPQRESNRSYELHSPPTSNPVQKIDNELPSPASSIASIKCGKKRTAASQDEFNGVESPDLSDTEHHRAPVSASSSPGEHVCLCQPEPKIPRPRNAFILYRQHHQHAIVAANPGLPNPDISKIIGEQWKAEGDAAKKVWQDLAQEEKGRHHEQYPEYRYQPRRLGKPLNPAVSHTTVDKYRCPRCGGRSIKTPSPSSPCPSSAITPTLPPPNFPENLTPSVRLPSIMNSLSMDSPARRRGTTGPSSLSNIQIPPTVREDGYGYTPMTPDSKRPRFTPYPMNNNGTRRPDGPYYHNRRDSLPPLQMCTTPPQTATMVPPRTPRDVRRGSVDLNVLVPFVNDQSRSVEAMVMSVPYTVKIKVLGRITPPLKDPSPGSPALQVRGGIIAVEGEDQAAVTELANWLNEFLARDKEYSPRIAEPPKQPECKGDVSFEEYFGLIQEWHGKSKEMVKYITTPVASGSSPKSPSSDNDQDEAMKESHTTPPTSPVPSAKPVLILPSYQLRASDAYASRIPIQDVYSPMDHWQWMATLWRGTVGPDLTIYIKSGDKERGDGGKLVDVNDEVRCMMVVKEGSGKFAEAALRRVGFEVGEWVRGLGTSKG